MTLLDPTGRNLAPGGTRTSERDLQGGRSDAGPFRRRPDGFDRRHWQSVGFIWFTCTAGVDLGEEAMFAPRGVSVTATDIPLLIDPVERGKSRSGKIESNILTRRHKEETMSYARGVGVPSDDPIRVVVSKQNRFH